MPEEINQPGSGNFLNQLGNTRTDTGQRRDVGEKRIKTGWSKGHKGSVAET
jgi:hypothetical protein